MNERLRFQIRPAQGHRRSEFTRAFPVHLRKSLGALGLGRSGVEVPQMQAACHSALRKKQPSKKGEFHVGIKSDVFSEFKRPEVLTQSPESRMTRPGLFFGR